MAVEEIINASSDLAPQLVSEVGKLALWLQAIGFIVVLWLIFNVVSLIVNFKRKKELEEIRKDIKSLNRKIDKLKNN